MLSMIMCMLNILLVMAMILSMLMLMLIARAPRFLSPGNYLDSYIQDFWQVSEYLGT